MPFVIPVGEVAIWLGGATAAALGWYVPGGGRDQVEKALTSKATPSVVQMSPAQQADNAKKEADKEGGAATGTCPSCPPTPNARPPNLAPDGATRDEALGKLKDDNNIPHDVEPDVGPQRNGEKNDKGAETLTYIDRDEKILDIPHHYDGHQYPDDPNQNRGPHFNGPDGSHYDYEGGPQPFGPLRR